MLKIKIAIITAALLLANAALGFSMIGNNKLEYRGARAGEGDEFFENRLDLRLSVSNISVGARFEAMQPSRSSAITRPDSSYTAITQRWAQLESDVVEITAGTYTATMGGGLLLDARERREIQEDHHLDGVRANVRTPLADISVLSGVADWNTIDDFTIRGGEIQTKIPYIPVGAGYIHYSDEAEAPLADMIGETWEVRAMPSWREFAAEVHYAETWRGENPGGYQLDGSALYITASAAAGPVTLFGQYLQADSFLVNGYGSGSALVTLPLVVRQPSYTLMSRHLEELSPVEVTAVSEEVFVFLNSGWELEGSFALVAKPDDENYYEIYGSLQNDWGDLHLKGLYELQQFPGDDILHNVVIEPLYYLSDRASLLADFELQTGTEYGQDVTHFYGLTEFALSPYGAVGIEGGALEEYSGGELETQYFARLYIDGRIAENHRLTLAVGRRPGGFTCSGGSCRYEPEFEGVELKLTSSF